MEKHPFHCYYFYVWRWRGGNSYFSQDTEYRLWLGEGNCTLPQRGANPVPWGLARRKPGESVPQPHFIAASHLMKLRKMSFPESRVGWQMDPQVKQNTRHVCYICNKGCVCIICMAHIFTSQKLSSKFSGITFLIFMDPIEVDLYWCHVAAPQRYQCSCVHRHLFYSSSLAQFPLCTSVLKNFFLVGREPKWN